MPSCSSASQINEQIPKVAIKLTLLWLITTVLVFAGLVKLGLWQNSRALEKEQRLARIDQLNAQAPLQLPQVLELLNSGENINDIPLTINGRFEGTELFLLDNQVNKSRLGYRVLQVVNSGDDAVLVNLGWIVGSINRDEIPSVVALTGDTVFSGHVRIPELGIQLQAQHFDKTTWPLRVQQIELDKFSSLIGRKLLPFVVYLDKKDSLGFEKNWQPIVMPPQKHRAYAFQWFSLATAWLLLMLWAKFGEKLGVIKNKVNGTRAQK